MIANSLLLCTDLDRTLLPNGQQPEHPAARDRFRKLCALPEVTLAYVTGRHLQLVEQAMAEYAVPCPDFVISDVGTKIYQHSREGWQELLPWQNRIALDWKGNGPEQLHQLIGEHPALILQEAEKQNSFKLSYYVALPVENGSLLRWVKERLEQTAIAANLVWSVDETIGQGLLDVLPESASKLHAIEFLQKHLQKTAQMTIFAGDSGNDLPVLASSIPAVLVANATAELKAQAQQLAAANGHTEELYLARDDCSPLGGNYSAGILQGVAHFAPQIVALLPELGDPA